MTFPLFTVHTSTLIFAFCNVANKYVATAEKDYLKITPKFKFFQRKAFTQSQFKKEKVALHSIAQNLIFLELPSPNNGFLMAPGRMTRNLMIDEYRTTYLTINENRADKCLRK